VAQVTHVCEQETDRPEAIRRVTSGLREAFAAPPPRPMTLYTSASYNGSTANSSTIGGKVAPNVPVPSRRLKSTMLNGPIEKPWTEEKDKLKRVAYW
jgi:hypothetical protein